MYTSYYLDIVKYMMYVVAESMICERTGMPINCKKQLFAGLTMKSLFCGLIESTRVNKLNM